MGWMVRMAAVLCVLGVLAQGVRASGDGGTLVVLNKGEASASLIDAASGREIGRIETGDGPHEVAVHPEGRIAVVADYGRREPGHTLSVLDLVAGERTKVVNLGSNTRPHGIVFSEDGRRVVVTTEGSGRLLVLDSESWEIVGSFPTRGRVSHMVALSGDGRRAFVANIGSGSVSVIDLVLEAFEKEIPTGGGAEGIAVSPDGREVWVSNREADTISVIDARTLRVVDTLACASFPIRVAFTPGGEHVLVSCARSGEVAVFDAKTRREVRRIRMDLRALDSDGRLFGDRFGDSSVPIGILIEPGGERAYVANTQADVVAVIDLSSWKLSGLIRAGREPDGMAWSVLDLAGEDDG